MTASAGYRELLARLLPARRFGVVLGLERIRGLLDRLGAPDRRLGTIVHVGGTNGKGSTVAMIAALAAAGGARVCAYTSPHLSSLRERIAIAGEPISEAAIVAAGEAVRAAGGDELTFFEQITAIAMVAIAAAAPDITVLEVGLGGRLDATNAVAPAPAIAVVTGVALDHEAVLGSTIAAIAAEKAGIFKPRQRVVIGAAGEAEAVPLLVAAARAAGAASVRVIDDAAIAAVGEVGLHGAHQRRNAAAAIAAVELLGLAVRADALATVRHPGRFEIIARPGAATVILDGAHNPHGAAALAAAIRARGERPVLVLAASADKDLAAIAGALTPVARAVVATAYGQDRAAAPAALAAVVVGIPGAPPVETAPDLEAALARADALAGTAGTIVIAGSLFIVGEARVKLCGAVADPIALSDPPAR